MLINSYRFGDAEAAAYIKAVETADGQPLETATAAAITAFIVGCKADGIWTAIKASCILAGARTLAGALVPLVGTAPTNFNFVSGDYNRKTGLAGNGSTKYLNSNRAGSADPQNSCHAIGYISTAATSDGTVYLGSSNTTSGSTNFGRNSLNELFFRCQSSGFAIASTTGSPAGFMGVQRSGGTSFNYRFNGATQSSATASQSPSTSTTCIFALGDGSAKVSARLAFYSIGESIDLALLDTRVTALITAINAAF